MNSTGKAYVTSQVHTSVRLTRDSSLTGLSRKMRRTELFKHLEYAYIGKYSVDNQVFVGLMDLDRLIAIAYGQAEDAAPFSIKRMFAPGVEDTMTLNVNPIRRQMPAETLQPLCGTI